MSENKTNLAGRALVRGAIMLRVTAVGLAAVALLGAPANAGNMYQPSTITAGGVPAQATINLNITSTNEMFSWYGMRGWSTILSSTNPGGPFTNFFASTEATDYAWSVTATQPTNQTLFFVLSQSNYYAGSGACSGCHGAKYAPWSKSLHAVAVSCILNPDGSFTSSHANASCLPCHTVGDNQPSGYLFNTNGGSTNYSSYLANVGCENCHGPAGWHKSSDHDVIRPAITVASEVCGGCHNGHNPQYTEWTNSPHATMLSDFASGISDTVSGQSRGVQCGACHSGAMRIAMLNNYNDRLSGYTNFLAVPTAHDVTNYAQTCVVCHDPHSPTYVSTNWVYSTNITYTTNIFSNYGIYHTNVVSATNITSSSNIVAIAYQLRNPMNSTNYYTFFTATPTAVTVFTNFAGVVTRTTNYLADAFTQQYDPKVQICAQCHNGRGARWDGIGRTWNGSNLVAGTASWSRPPHPADQYDMLIGIIQPDYLNTNSSGVATNYSAAHSGIMNRSPYNTNQCATCHMPIYTSGGTNISGHTFALDVNGCALGGCHSSGVPNWQNTQTNTINSISNVVVLLNQWAVSNGPALFGTNYPNYLQNAWEYTTPGALAGITNGGPSTGDQPKLPNAIKQARFDVYMVQGDGSFGVHNPGYISFLLNDAKNKVTGQINPAYFSASPTVGFTPLTVQFTSFGSGITGYSWDFGDGTTGTGANPSHTYTNAGSIPVTNTVTLVVNTGSGYVTNVMNNYIVVGIPPVPAFTANVTSGTHPLTVTFTNLTPALPPVSAFRWTFFGGVSGSPTSTKTNATVSFTYTNAGVYNVYLRATAVGGNVTVSNNAYISVQ